jgi:hypothetical protein
MEPQAHDENDWSAKAHDRDARIAAWAWWTTLSHDPSEVRRSIDPSSSCG